MPRKNDASRSRRNSYQRVDPKQCTIWTHLGRKSLQSQRKIQYWSLGSIFVSRSNQILVSNSERYWQICQRSHADPRGRGSFGETRCKSEPIRKPSSFRLDRENGRTLKHRSQMILAVFKCRNSSLDYYDTVKEFNEKLMEQSITTKLLMNARKSNSTIMNIGQLTQRRNSSMPHIGRLLNGYLFWQKVEDKRKGFKIVWTRTILRNSCTFEQSKDIQEVQSILHCKTMYCYQKILPSILSRRKRKRIVVNSKPWFDSRRSQSQNGETSCVLHCCESDG